MKFGMVFKLHATILIYILACCISDQAIAQSSHSGPAYGSITGGDSVSTSQFAEKISIIVKKPKIYNSMWEKFPIYPADDKYNNTPASAPEASNEFIDPNVELSLKDDYDPPAVIIDFLGAMDPSSHIPPDPHLSVGPDHIIVQENSRFIIFDKQGNLLKTIDASTWYNSVFPGNNANDCQVIYDHITERWVQLWMTGGGGNTHYWLLSVSDDSNPLGYWRNYIFPSHLNGNSNAGNWGDYPKLTYDHQAIYITANQFSFSSVYQYCKIRIIPKSELYDTNVSVVNYIDFWDFRDPANTSVRVFGPPIHSIPMDSTLENIAHFVVNSPYYTSTFVTLWTINDPIGVPTAAASNISVTVSYPPQDANQLGGGTPRISSNNDQFRNAVLKNDNIWTAHSIRGGTGNQYTFARYLRLDVNTLSATEDLSFGANGFYYIFPAIMVDEDDNMTMAFTRSADTEYAGAAYTGRKSNDPPGLSASVLFKEGEANYVKTFGGSRNRWGDYMGIALDPVYNNSIWALVEYAASPSSTWGVWVGAFTHFYSASGTIIDGNTQAPISLANIEVIESGNDIQTDSTGTFSFGAPISNISVNIETFGYQDTTIYKNLTLYAPDTFNIEIFPEIEATLSGQILDSLGNGIYGEINFYVEGNPNPGPYANIMSDTAGNYSLTTIIGNYDIEIFPESPYPYTYISNVNLISTGLNYNIILSPAEVMLVDDDNGMNYENYYITDMKNIGKSYHHWDVEISGLPTSEIRNAYPNRNIIWFTGDSTSIPLTQDEKNEIFNHLSNGGKLFLTGQDIAEYGTGDPFLNLMGIDYNSNSILALIFGVSGDLISNGLTLFTSGGGGAQNQKSRDVINIIDSNTATAIFYYGPGTANLAGVRYADGFYGSAAVFLGFGYESINDASRRQTLLTNTLDYLNNSVTGIEEFEAGNIIPREFSLKQNYPNPFNPSTTIEFNVATKTQVKILIYNSLGQRVTTLLDKDIVAGTYKTIWNGLDLKGNRLSSGVYYYQMKTESGFKNTKKLLLLK